MPFGYRGRFDVKVPNGTVVLPNLNKATCCYSE